MFVNVVVIWIVNVVFRVIWIVIFVFFVSFVLSCWLSFFFGHVFLFFCYLGSYVTLQIVENEGKVRNLMNHPEEEHRYFTMFHHVSYVGGEKHEKNTFF